jgi:hypothetical protein
MRPPPFFDWAGSRFVPWAQTPGFGGVAAVFAATIAFAASRYQARVQRSAQRKEQWWKRAEWALNLTLSDDPAFRELGLEMLEALSESEWRHEHEDDVIAAAKDRLRASGNDLPDLTIPHIKSERGGRNTHDPGHDSTAIGGDDQRADRLAPRADRLGAPDRQARQEP